MNLEQTKEKIFSSETFVLEEMKRLQFLFTLKREIRYGQKSTDSADVESVAEHIYGMHVLFNYFWHLEDPDCNWNKAKMLSMITFHDIDEVVTGDIIGYDKTDEHRKAEEEAIAVVLKNMPQSMAIETQQILKEYDARESIESKFVKAIDKIEPIVHIFNPEGKSMLHKMGTTYEQNARIKIPHFQEFPVIMRFYKVVSDKMRSEGFFTEST